MVADLSADPWEDLWTRDVDIKQDTMEGIKELQEAATRSRMAHLALDKNAEEFREAHKARQEVVRQWESALDLLGNITHKRKKN